jgi:hypothetical protein
MEQRPPTRPRVLLYPTRKESAFLEYGEAKKCVHQYSPLIKLSALSTMLLQLNCLPRRWHSGAQIRHGQTNNEDEHRREEPSPNKSDGSGGDTVGQSTGYTGKKPHDTECYSKNFYHCEVATQLLLVAQFGCSIALNC